MCKCKGCGVVLQNFSDIELGYTKNMDNDLCERCFRIINYNEYKTVIAYNEDYINILKKISNTNDLVLLIVDLFNIPYNLENIKKYIKNDIFLIITKRDILPKSCNDQKIIDYFDNYELNIVDKILISSKKNYNLDLLFNKINKLKKSDNVYVVGFTNSGKSTLINKIIYNYSMNSSSITTSNLPSTTIDSISVKVNDNLNLVDTPGLLNDNDIINYVSMIELKKIIPDKEIKPITYQIKNKQSILIGDILKLDVLNNTNITIYMSNSLNITRIYKDNKKNDYLESKKLTVLENEDLVIEGLGFISFKKRSDVIVYLKYPIKVYTRRGLI